ncbi:MAG: DUF1080 domain-containing protein [Fidelibacterota bacterium]|nr:MAG: DUF1080 domain-containing protein [Candidatus Neomarinimicrobiota bacterium]
MNRSAARWAAGAVLVLLLAIGCTPAGEQTLLFNGQDLSGWVFVLRDKDVDPMTVWSVRDGVIHCTGEPFGYMRTEADYADYKLHVEWRWPDEAGNSGVFLHMSLPDTVWPRSIECQLMSGNAGDFVTFQGVRFKELVEDRVLKKKTESSEKAPGQWNSYDITCHGDTIRVSVNGVLQNEATETTISSGKICLQSEGKPIEFRNIYVEPL